MRLERLYVLSLNKSYHCQKKCVSTARPFCAVTAEHVANKQGRRTPCEHSDIAKIKPSQRV